MPGSPTDLAITHVQNGNADGGLPPDCLDLPVSPPMAGNPDFVAPTSGLYGSASIINVGEGTFFGYAADALSGFSSKVLLDSSELPASLAQANSPESTFESGATATILSGSGQPTTIDFQHGIDAVSAVFMADAIYNDYFTASALGAATDWVVTFPTKAYYTDPFYLSDDAALPPFDEPFHAPGQSDVAMHADVYDNEEGANSTFPPPEGCGTICPPVSPLAAPYMVNVLGILGSAVADVPGVLGSDLRTPVYLFPSTSHPASGDSGSIKLELALSGQSLTTGVDANGESVRLNGLPVTGFAVENVINAQAQPGKLANYSGLFPHRTTVSCEPDVNPPVTDPCH